MKTLVCTLPLAFSAMLLNTVLAEDLPDPTRPANYSSRPVSVQDLPKEMNNWNVHAIRTSPTGRNAVVNGRVVRVGDAIDTATIVDITPYAVVLAFDKKELVLKLMPADIKKKRDLEPPDKSAD